MTNGIFVTGTDTGVGKTLVAAGLVRLAASRGRRVVGLKPVASGAERTPHGLRNDDARRLAAESSIGLPYESSNPLCFEPAIAPHIAAAEAGVPMPVAELVDWYVRTTEGSDVAIVEGAGGWRVPLHPEGFLSDLPERLGLGVLLVVGLRLGCLNHARLTLEALTHSGRCRYLGWVGNCIDPAMPRLDANLESLARLLGGPPMAVVPPLPTPTTAAVVEHLRRPELARMLGLAA